MGFFNTGGRQEDLGPPPPPFRIDGQTGPGLSGTALWLLLIGLGVVLFVIANTGKEIYTEWLWFQSVSYSGVYTTILFTQVALFFAGALVFLVLLLVNIFLARWLAPKGGDLPIPQEELLFARRMINAGILGGGLFLAVIFGSIAAGEWSIFLKFQNAQSFGVADPMFGRDVGFYVFTLPLYRFLQMWAVGALVVVLIGTVVIYGFSYSLQRFNLTLSPAVKGHLSFLGALIFLTFSFGYWLDAFDLLFSPHGVVFGASYTDVNARWFALRSLMAISAISAVLLLANTFFRGIGLALLGMGGWILVAVALGGLYPQAVQRFQVLPNELVKEEPYIKRNIEFTRLAYGLERIQEQPYPAEEAPSQADITANPDTMNNIRLWDVDPLKETYNQIQSIRLYYDFHDVDVDRYWIDGKYRQVMLGARELSQEKLAVQAQTWVNQRLQFTHGYGVALSPVNEFSPEGLPSLMVKDVPPKGIPEVARPELYYGEKTLNHVIVNGEVPEFDYPKGDENVYSEYTGEGGVGIGSWFRRLLYAWQLADPNMLLTQQLTPESRVLYYRHIQERVRHIAPFLVLDKDPYLVIDQGRLFWIQDAYTVTDKYPYSDPMNRRFNYIRNSVKAVVDAYSGAVRFYVAEPGDPLIQSYASIFPSLFLPLEEMPKGLLAHVRYPEDLFRIQSVMYQTYHMRDPRVFYSKEDYYELPREIYLEKEQQMAAYYVIMRLPGEDKPEFLLLLPFTPANKNNTIAWLAARSDGEHYGKLTAFLFPKDRLIYGPLQIESRINQDPTISAQFTLWNQAGSRVLRGNLLMIPLERSFIYVEPIYLQSEQSKLPELKRVIVAVGNRIVMEPTLERSLLMVFGGAAPPALVSPRPPVNGPPAEIRGVASLARSAQEQYRRAQELLKTGDWAGFGEALRAMERALTELVEQTRDQ